ncbi:MAG TPA: hypothetical protein VL088_13460, partial [Pedobacter sp.]|nr:hypothetical protein [Pedobacter sp.]
SQIGIKSANADKFPGKQIFKRTMYFDIEKLTGEGAFTLTLIDYYPDIEFSQPIIFENDGQRKFKVYLNNYHPLFRDFADGYEDLIYMEVASKYSVLKNNEEWTVSRIYYELKSRYAQETMLSVPKLVNKANDLMRTIQNKLVAGEGIRFTRKPVLTDQDEKLLKQKHLDLEGKPLHDINSFIMNTKYLKYLDLNYLFRFMEEFPEMIFDGKVFNLPYTEIDDKELMQRELKKYINYFNDVRWFINDLQQEGDEAIKKRKPLILRNRLSIEILYGSISK